MSYVKGAKQVDITQLLADDNMKERLAKVINYGLHNRKTRDTLQNDVSSRSILIFFIFATVKYPSGNE